MASINCDSSFTELIEQLCSKELNSSGVEVGTGLFPEYRDVVMFAAMVGYKQDETKKPDSQGKTLPMRVFESARYDELIFLVALMNKQDANILRKDDYQDNENEVVEIFESYANGGLKVISSWISEEDGFDQSRQVLLEKITECLGNKLTIADGEVEF